MLVSRHYLLGLLSSLSLLALLLGLLMSGFIPANVRVG